MNIVFFFRGKASFSDTPVEYSYWTPVEIDDLPIKHGDFQLTVELPYMVPHDMQARACMCSLLFLYNSWMGFSFSNYMGMGQNLVPLVNLKIAGKWMFIPLKMYLQVLTHTHIHPIYTPYTPHIHPIYTPYISIHVRPLTRTPRWVSMKSLQWLCPGGGDGLSVLSWWYPP